jgi:hypothetical protein
MSIIKYGVPRTDPELDQNFELRNSSIQVSIIVNVMLLLELHLVMNMYEEKEILWAIADC